MEILCAFLFGSFSYRLLLGVSGVFFQRYVYLSLHCGITLLMVCFAFKIKDTLKAFNDFKNKQKGV